MVRSASRKLIQKEQSEVANACKTNPKKFWKFVRSRSNQQPKGVADISVVDECGNEKLLTDDLQKANAFVEYFSSVFTQEPMSNFDKLDQLVPINHMDAIIMTEKQIENELTKLKTDKSPGPDDIHPRILKELCPQITNALKIIFDVSLATGQLPDEWKSSTVSVIYKKGKKSVVSNYRPISLTCIACKIMESLIKNDVMHYLLTNKLISVKQFGFVKGRSTNIQLLKLFDQWTNCLENGGQVDVIYTDFEKAFDKVPHKRLLSKLISLGLNVEVIEWIKEFICYRKHRVRINEKFSHWKTVESGIPQGSVLGPLLFVLYINNLPSACDKGADTFLFADDAKLYKHITAKIDSLALQDSCQRDRKSVV